MRIVRRAEWGAQYADGGGPAPLPCRGLYVHHSVTPAANGPAAVRNLEKVGQQRFGQGISYSFAVTPDGTLYEGHSIGRRGAHTRGLNSQVRAVVLVGDYSNTPPTDAQQQAVADLLRHGVAQRWWPSARLLGGHRDAPGASTACPGNAAYRAIPAINALAAGEQPTPQPVPGGIPVLEMPLLRRGSPERFHVFQMQSALAGHGLLHRDDCDGLFGPGSEGALNAFARRRGMPANGVCDGAKWRELYTWRGAGK